VGLVTVAAADPFPVHLALQKRTVDVDFILDLAVWIVKLLFEERHPMSVEKRFSVDILF
tara:strand:- start:26 stop:202 length:177 start_codon:yes stop_codon:yes gene_type:complete